MARSTAPYATTNARPRPAPAAQRGAMQRGRRPGVPLFHVLGLLFVAAIVGALVVGLMLALLVERQARRDEAAPSDTIVVLGAAQWDGKPSPVLQARLDHAYDLYAAGLAPNVIVTGGVGMGDQYSEGEIARQYLIRRGVPAKAVFAEEQGRSSYESLQGVAQMMHSHGWQRALLVSDPFHMYRLKRMASDLGVQGRTSPTRSSPIRPGSETEWAYVLREIASLADYLVFHR